MQRRAPGRVYDVGVRSGRQQCIEDRGSQSRHVQRRLALPILNVGLGTGLQKHPDGVHQPFGNGHMQRRVPGRVYDVGVRSGGQQRIEDRRPQFRQMQWHLALPILNVGLGTRLQQHPDSVHQPFGNGHMQRRVPGRVYGSGGQQRIEDRKPQFRQVQRCLALPILNVGIGTGLQQHPDGVHQPFGNGHMQRRVPGRVYDVGVRSGGQQRIEDRRPQSCHVQRHLALPILNVGIGTRLQKHADRIQMPLGYSQV